MRIEEKPKESPLVVLGKIKNGELFKLARAGSKTTPEGYLFMKTSIGNVALDTGEICEFWSDELVQRWDGTLMAWEV